MLCMLIHCPDDFQLQESRRMALLPVPQAFESIGQQLALTGVNSATVLEVQLSPKPGPQTGQSQSSFVCRYQLPYLRSMSVWLYRGHFQSSDILSSHCVVALQYQGSQLTTGYKCIKATLGLYYQRTKVFLGLVYNLNCLVAGSFLKDTSLFQVTKNSFQLTENGFPYVPNNGSPKNKQTKKKQQQQENSKKLHIIGSRNVDSIWGN